MQQTYIKSMADGIHLYDLEYMNLYHQRITIQLSKNMILNMIEPSIHELFTDWLFLFGYTQIYPNTWQTETTNIRLVAGKFLIESIRTENKTDVDHYKLVSRSYSLIVAFLELCAEITNGYNHFRESS